MNFMNTKSNATRYLKVGLIIIISLSFLFLNGAIKKKRVFADNTADAIAVRILPNPNHYSPLRWYKEQGFKGKPKTIKVDGYQAIRDGRTVYVNVANVTGFCSNNSGVSCISSSDCSSNASCLFGLYTNIYLISYNQNANEDTLGIFDRIIKNWKFNINLIQPGQCSGDSERNCLVDNDCSENSFCSSFKSRITRDIKRLSDVTEIKEAINAYKDSRGFYPKLTAGTYLSGKTISTWPSWRKTFSQEIGFNAPVDPINRMGDCGGGEYDENTCWNDTTKSFAGSIPNGLPSGSNVIAYSVSDNGLSYDVCGIMESGLLVDGVSAEACAGSFTDNTPPTVECGGLIAISGESFEGYVIAKDNEGDNLDIQINNLPTGFTTSETNDRNKIKIIASNVTLGGNTQFTVNVSDGINNINQNCQITLNKEAFIVYPVQDIKILGSGELKESGELLTIYANHTQKKYDDIGFDFEIETINSSAGSTLILSCNKDGISIENDGRVKCNPMIMHAGTGEYKVTFNAHNNNGESTKQSFKVVIYNNPPQMKAINCRNKIRLDDNYECEIKATDIDEKGIRNFSISNLPDGLTLEHRPHSDVAKIHRTNHNENIEVGVFDIKITAIDNVGAISEPIIYNLEVNNYCGDGIKQFPNTEAKGGLRNDGYEDCDGEDGLATVENSSIASQYGCSDDCTNSKGGWCGDGIAQDGRFVDFLSTDGIQTIYTSNETTIDMKHGENNYGEQCDFEKDNSCCKGCQWDNNTTVQYQIPEFSLASGETHTIALPRMRDIRGGTITRKINTENVGGSAVIFLVDLTASGINSRATEYYKTSIREAIDNIYNRANNDNLDMSVGMIGFGGCNEGTSNQGICNEQGIVNLRNVTNSGEGILNKDALNTHIDQYAFQNDLSGSNSGLADALTRANTLLSNYSNVDNDKKFIIVLGDGIVDYANNRDGTISNPNQDIVSSIATSIKNSGIKIYTITYFKDDSCPNTMPSIPPALDNNINTSCISLSNLCKWSSANGIDCYSSDYSNTGEFNRNSYETSVSSAYASAISSMLSYIPSQITYNILNLSGNIDNNIVNFDAPDIFCNNTGMCNHSMVDFSTSFVGQGRVAFDISLNILPACE